MNQFTASLWGDEAWAATLAIKPIFEIIKIVAKDTSPPLYYLLLHTWMKIFGTSEIAIRSLSFLFFIGTAIVVYFIGKHLWDKKTGILASLLTLANPFLFAYAFEGRMYSLLALTSTLSIFFFLKGYRWGFILATTAALYTHHFSLFMVIFEAIWRLRESWGKNLKQFVKNFSDFLIIGAFYLPWIYPLYYQTSLVGSGFWLGKPTLNILKETIQKFLVGSGKEILRQVAYWSIIAILVLRKWSKEGRKTIFLGGWFFTPLILTYIASQFFQSIFFDRYLLIAIPALPLLIASGKRKFSFIITLVVIFCLGILNWGYFSHPPKPPFRELANFVKSQAKDLPLINHNAAAHHLWESKYYGLRAPIYAPQSLPFYTGTALMQPGDTIRELPKEKKIGIITSAPVEEVKIPGYHQIKSQSFDKLLFIWMEKD